MQPYASIHHHASSNISSHLQEPYFNYNQLLNASSNYSGSSYNNTHCQLSTPSQPYLQQEQILQTNNHLPIYNQPNFFQYGQNQSTSLQNLCFDYEAMVGALPEDKPGQIYGVLDTYAWQENNNLQDNFEKDNDNFHNVLGAKHGKKRFIQRNKQLDNLAFEQQPWPCLMEKSTEKIKKQRKQTGCLQGQYATMTMKDQDNISSDSSPQKRQPKKQSLSEATTVFDHIEHSPNETPSTPYKKIKLNEFSLKNNYSIVSQNNELNHSKSANNNKNPCQVVFPQVESQTNAHKKLHLTTEKAPGSNLVANDLPPNKTSIETLQGIMKSLPLAYLPFLHKQQSDSQKLEYLKRYHNTALQVDLARLRQLLPANFIKSFDVNPSEVYSNAFIMEGIRRNLPDESAKKIGPLTKRERRDKINKYKQKRNKRASCRKVSYDVRKRVADSRLRVKGRFVTKDQAVHMIGDISGDIDRYSNQELRALLVQRFGSEINNDSPMPS